ncbi:MAG TPA: helix-turn-helix domain-containing protein [Allosphingosinicella sp.]|jgi:Cu(I)-responsive transcriptional regulator
MKIGDIAAATGVHVETIRYYEREGLVPSPPRTASNYRSYGDAHRRRLTFIRRARDLGFSLVQVRELLDLADDRERPCVAVDEIASKHLLRVREKIAELTALRKELDHMIGQCRHGSISECRIIDALAPETGRGPTR